MGLITETRKAIQDAPKGMFNAYVLMCTCVFAFAGVAKGFDEGIYMNSLREVGMANGLSVVGRKYCIACYSAAFQGEVWH